MAGAVASAIEQHVRRRVFATKAPRIAAWVQSRVPECAFFVLGAALRVTMLWRFHADWGFDAKEHWDYVEWILQHRAIPLPENVLEAQHPPLFYLLVAFLVHHGVGRQSAIALPVVCGVLRLALVWCGLEWYLPRWRRARIAALALVAVLPASIHVDGMLYPEPLSGLLAAAIMLLIPLGFEAAGKRRWWLAGAVGVLLGVEMLTKISGLVLVFAIGVVASCEMLFSQRATWRDRARDFAPWCASIAVCAAIGGWFYVRNFVHYRDPFVTCFELPTQWMARVAASSLIPYLDRRTLGFVFGWDGSIYKFPYYPSAAGEHPRFFPITVASTFVDYYNYSFSGLPWSLPSKLHGQNRPLTESLLLLSRGSVLGGTVIVVPTVVATVALLRRTFRGADWGAFCLLLLPVVTTVLALHFAINYPHDELGVIKGEYLQFSAPPLYAAFGIAVEWALARRRRWPLAGAMLLGVTLIGAYTVCCRTGLLLL
jgi:4-amino-4-deoxy-L-arabinose transferase-like glycosyltransferase